MRLLALLLSGGAPQPHPTPSADAWHAAPDPVALGLILSIVFVPGMFALFCLGCGELFDWWQRRGWRAKQNRRPLK